MTKRLGELLTRLVALPARRPVMTLCATAVLAAMAGVAVSRVRPDTSLEAMFPREDPAAKALVRVLNRFGAAEELLVLASVPGEGGDPTADVPRLLDFARRFEKAVAQSPEASAQTEAVVYRADEETRKFFEQVLVPNGMFYLDAASFDAARQRLTREEMRRQIERNEAAVSQPGPAAQAMSKVLLQDPLRLHEFIKEKFTAGRAFKTLPGTDAFVSADGRCLLVRVQGKRPPSDIDFAKSFTANVRSLAEQANVDGLQLGYGGSYAIAATSERSIRSDTTSSIVSSIVMLLVMFVVASRRPLRVFHLTFLPVALGILLGFGAYATFFPTLNPLTGVVGAILAGMGIDYSIHFLCHYQHRREAGGSAADAAAATGAELGPPLFAAWLTSVIGFLAIACSSVGALRDFALLGSLGLAGSFLAAVFVLPAILALVDRRAAESVKGRPDGPRFDTSAVTRWTLRRRGVLLPASIVLVLGACAVVVSGGGDVLPLETDLTVMHPRPNAALETQSEIARRFGSAPASFIVHLRAENPEQLVTLAHRVDERLASPGVRGKGIGATFGLATLLPDPRLAASRAAAVDPAEADRVAGDFRAVIADSAFDSNAYEPYAGFLRHLLSQRTPPTLASLLPYRRLARTFLPDSVLRADAPAAGETEAITLVFVTGPAEDRAARNAAVAAARGALGDLPGATLTGLTVLSHDTESQVRRELPRLFGLAGALVGLYLLLHFRSVRDSALALLPTAISLVLLLAVMKLTGQKLNMMNLVALPLLIGMDVDYGIFVVSHARAARRAKGVAADTGSGGLLSALGSSSYATLLCAASTVLGFGSLVTTSVPAIRSLGFVVGVGVLGCLYGTLFVLAPLMLKRKSPRDVKAALPAGGGPQRVRGRLPVATAAAP